VCVCVCVCVCVIRLMFSCSSAASELCYRHPCGEHATCKSDSASFMCVCDPGFVKNFSSDTQCSGQSVVTAMIALHAVLLLLYVVRDENKPNSQHG